MFTKLKYYWHSFRYRYHEILLNDCLSHEIREKLRGKVAYHEEKVLSISIRM